MSSGTIYFTLVENLQDDADSFHREGLNNVAEWLTRRKAACSTFVFNFHHPSYVEILYCVVRSHRKPLSTLCVYLSNLIG